MAKTNQKRSSTSHNRSKNRSSATKEWSISGKVVIITGANTGIGKATAIEMAKRGARRIILACQSVRDGELAAQEIRKHRASSSTSVVVREIDLASLASVRRFATRINATERVVHVLINNAGILGPATRHESVDGNELTLATNFLGPFLLTKLLLDLLKKSAPSRIINVATGTFLIWLYSKGFHLFDDPNFEEPTSPYTWTAAYFQSKLAIILFTRWLHRKLEGSHVSTFTLHPGIVASDITRNFNSFCRFFYPYFGRTPAKGAQTTVYCATEPGIEHLSSGYFIDCVQRNPGNYGNYNDEMAEQVWEIAEKLTHINNNDK